jgi:hypothetical protein
MQYTSVRRRSGPFTEDQRQAELLAVARVIWPVVRKCDLRNVSNGPCSLGEGVDGCGCWAPVLEQARSVIAALDDERTRWTPPAARS